MSYKEASESIIAFLNRALELPQGESVLLRLESDNPQSNNLLYCLVNTLKHQRCGRRIKREAQEHDTALSCFRELDSTSKNQPLIVRRILNRIKFETTFCCSHKEKVRNIIEDELQIPDDAELPSALIPERTDGAAPMNATSKTPKGLYRNSLRTGKVPAPNVLEKSLKKLCMMPFHQGKKNLEWGYIYALQFTDSEYTDYLKIGYTKKAAELRAEQISHSCRAPVKVVYQSDEVMNPFLIERLIQKQLEFLRYKRLNCPSCGTTHKELFRMREEDLLSKVGSNVIRWAKWMNEHPYSGESTGRGNYRFHLNAKKESSLEGVIRELIDEAIAAGDMVYHSETMSSAVFRGSSFQSSREELEFESDADSTGIDDENICHGESRVSTETTGNSGLPEYGDEMPSIGFSSIMTPEPDFSIPRYRHTKRSLSVQSRRSSMTSVTRVNKVPPSSSAWQSQYSRSRRSALPTPDKTPSPRLEDTGLYSRAETINWERRHSTDTVNNSFQYASDEFYRAGALIIDFAALSLITPETKLRFFNLAQEIQMECIQKRSMMAQGAI